MADEQTPAAAQKQLLLQKIYVKDLSFESPKAPGVFTTSVSPQTQLNIRSGAQEIAPDTHEVTLTMTVEAKDKDTTIVPDRDRASRDFPRSRDTRRRAGECSIGSFCPNTLYPFAREAIADMSARAASRSSCSSRSTSTRSTRKRCESARNGGDGQRPQPRRRGDALARDRIAVLGAGSWGTALAIQFARAGHSAVLWGRDALRSTAMAARAPQRALPSPTPVSRTSSRSRAICARRSSAARDMLVAVPSQGFRTLLEALAPLAVTRLAWATKGFELDTGLLPYQVVAEVLRGRMPTAVLSGPTFAREVGAGLPSAMTVASANRAYAQRARARRSAPNIPRLHVGRHVGVEVGGATKNVYAIGAGHLRRTRLRREHAHRADHARARRDDAARRRARRAARRRSWASRAWATSC